MKPYHLGKATGSIQGLIKKMDKNLIEYFKNEELIDFLDGDAIENEIPVTGSKAITFIW